MYDGVMARVRVTFVSDEFSCLSPAIASLIKVKRGLQTEWTGIAKYVDDHRGSEFGSQGPFLFSYQAIKKQKSYS